MSGGSSDDDDVERRMMNIWQQWHTKYAERKEEEQDGGVVRTGMRDEDEVAAAAAAPTPTVLVLNFSVEKLCSPIEAAAAAAAHHHGARKGVCQLREDPDIAFAARYIATEEKEGGKCFDDDGSPGCKIREELQSLQRIKDAGLRVIPFLNRVIVFRCGTDNHHPGVPRSWDAQIADVPQGLCAGYLMRYVRGKEFILLKPRELYNAVMKVPEDAPPPVRGLRYWESQKETVAKLRAMPQAAAAKLVATMRKIHHRLVEANINIRTLQGMLNTLNGNHYIIDTNLRKGRRPVTVSTPWARDGLAFADWLEKAHGGGGGGGLFPPVDGWQQQEEKEGMETTTQAEKEEDNSNSNTNKNKKKKRSRQHGYGGDEDDDTSVVTAAAAAAEAAAAAIKKRQMMMMMQKRLKANTMTSGRIYTTDGNRHDTPYHPWQ